MTERTPSGLAYEITGAGPAVLLIHAGIADRSMWAPQWTAWAEDFTLICFDQRGFGDSPDPDAPYTLHGDALEVLESASADRAALIGASMGGKAAIDLTLAAPERVSALIAVVATPSGWKPSPDLMAAWERVDETFERSGLEAANELELQMWVDGPGRNAGAANAGARESTGVMNAAALAREVARERAGNSIEPDPLEPPALERLGEIDVPALAITGEHDQPNVNAGARAFADATGAELVEIAATAHMPNLERPAEFEAAALGFLRANAR